MKSLMVTLLVVGLLSGCAYSDNGAQTRIAAAPILASTEAPASQPATQPAMPALPSGHPDISKLQNAPALPSGHPDISKMTNDNNTPALPSGHPDISKLQNQGASPALPSGHPDISKLQAEAAKTMGMLIIQAVQSTPNGPKVGGDDFTVSFYANDKYLDKLEGSLDENGAASVGGIPFAFNAHAVVKIKHNGVEYEATSKVIDAKSPQVTLEVPVYEKAPATTKPSVSLIPTGKDTTHSAQVVAASGGAFVVLLGVGFMLIKGSK